MYKKSHNVITDKFIIWLKGSDNNLLYMGPESKRLSYNKMYKKLNDVITDQFIILLKESDNTLLYMGPESKRLS
jgi:hypothetical protein